jgi:hypothetical protein
MPNGNDSDEQFPFGAFTTNQATSPMKLHEVSKRSISRSHATEACTGKFPVL